MCGAGTPWLVTGKLGINEWQSETGPRTVVQVDAAAVGHDLSFGTANFSRSGGRSQRPEQTEGTQARDEEDDRAGDGTGGVAHHDSGTEHGERFRDAQSLGLAENGFVDVTSGAVIAVDEDDHTFDGLGDRNGDAGGGNTEAELSEPEDREPASAVS